MPQGKIKKIFSGKGFGFIEAPGGKDIFFHRSRVTDSGFDMLRQGQIVEFEMAEKRGEYKGPCAESVSPPSKVAAALHEILEGRS